MKLADEMRDLYSRPEIKTIKPLTMGPRAPVRKMEAVYPTHTLYNAASSHIFSSHHDPILKDLIVDDYGEGNSL